MGLTKSRLRAQLSTGIVENDEKLIKATIEEMKESGTDINIIVTNDGHTPYTLALEGIHSGKVKQETFKLLLKCGFDVNKTMESALAFSPLYTAVRRNQLDCVRQLLAAGADPKQGESTGEDPLFTACGMGFADCVQLLLEAGANPNSISPGPGGTPMMLTAQTSHINAPRILKLLIQHGANVHHLNSVERNGLHAAADSLADVIECSQILIDAGVDVNKEDMFGQTPMHMAAIANRPRIIKLFIEYGGKADIKSKEGNTPLDVAIKMENKESIEILKAFGDVKVLKQSPEDTSGACVATDKLLVDISEDHNVAGKGQDGKGQDGGATAAEPEDETLIDISNVQPTNPEPTDAPNNHTAEK